MDQTSDVQLHIGNLQIPGSRLRAPRNDGETTSIDSHALSAILIRRAR
jgi:hypothetical protein